MRHLALPLTLLLISSPGALFPQSGTTLRGTSSNERYQEGTARIVLEDGSVPRTAPLIIAECPTADPNCKCQTQFFLGGTLQFRVVNSSLGPGSCFVSVRLQCYQTVKTTIHDGTVIKLYRAGPNEDVSTSKASLHVPPEAKKHYESGEAAAAKKKWSKAEEEFHAALGIDPGYAMALSELGSVLRQQDRLGEAIDALNKARDADPSYIKPLIQLAEVAGLQQRWADEMRLCQEALKLRPAGSATIYYYCAQAAFHAGAPDVAERMAREAVTLATPKECPESMVLLGEIFEKEGNVSDALVEYKAYLKLAPHGIEAQHAKDALARLKVG